MVVSTSHNLSRRIRILTSTKQGVLHSLLTFQRSRLHSHTQFDDLLSRRCISLDSRQFLDRHRQLASEIKRDSRTAMAMLDGWEQHVPGAQPQEADDAGTQLRWLDLSHNPALGDQVAQRVAQLAPKLWPHLMGLNPHYSRTPPPWPAPS